MKLDWKTIVQHMEGMDSKQPLRFNLHETFGGGMAIVSMEWVNAEKGEKKYTLKWGKDEEKAKQVAPLMTSDKPKGMAKWIADRLGELIA
jgi:hypothetical protein